jgi:hypothetical protein
MRRWFEMKRMRVWLRGTLAALCLFAGPAYGMQAPTPSVETPESMDVRVHIELEPAITQLAAFLGLGDEAWTDSRESRDVGSQGDPHKPLGVSQHRKECGRGTLIHGCLAAARVLTRVVIRQVHRQIIVPIVS